MRRRPGNPLNRFKFEVARELGLSDKISTDPGEMTTREAGKIGGNMVKKMIEIAERQIRNNNPPDK